MNLMFRLMVVVIFCKDALGAVTKLYNYINGAELSAEAVLRIVTRDDDGVLDLAEFRDGLHAAGLNLAAFPHVQVRLPPS